MDQRTRNRLKEHSGAGHKLTQTDIESEHQPDKQFFHCICGWIGWL